MNSGLQDVAGPGFREGAQRLGLALSGAVQEKQLHFLGLVAQWNRVFNLTAIRDPLEMVHRHLLDSLSVLPHLRGSNLLDVGSGAGFPGIPLALVRPDLRFTLIDSSGKKTRFLLQARAELDLRNVEVVQARVEQFRPDRIYDQILCRAFASLRDFLSRSVHLAGPDTQWLAMKGGNFAEELSAVDPAFRLESMHSLLVPGLQAERNLLIMKRRGVES